MNQLVEPPLYARAIIALSEALLSLEKLVVAGLMGVLLALILLNVVTRYSGHPLYWVDESAVYAMVWLAFIGGSALTRLRLDFSVTLLTDYLPPAAARWMRAGSTLLVLLFALALAAFSWLWMDPVGIFRAGFDTKAFAAESFNFLYTERSQTLNWPIWAISLVIPLFAVTMTVHCAANLVEDLGLSPQQKRRELSSAEGVN
ncbi:TRAP transporter small permease [Sinorhizobium medicae]|uniref:TRAP transporter small permease n=1 Tax=Sinorhizobium medicae TaxID=110321 RepID=UPI000C79B157|nr:TRAP transporter small permease [Sinorhizobium medicae]MBO1961340.1 TRAP transporter small permease [Sinorhizobium medicae]MDX1198521.1 TRAP transporter small permease subunit [Sinorhizobium medicae]PLU51476.1 C4-dicarboxylate ABC transporter permease [Sinorhizobium medicae]WQO56384.1 TRAP transporter small permease [Sinorhizobium medicae]WQP42294.1 TRAP transporter small permease [Sinorhizobium medicae]